MQNPTTSEVTRLLEDSRGGSKAALDRLMPIIYNELHKLARGYLRSERPGHTLQPTALIHELYQRLVDHSVPQWQNRAHFFGVAARAMRQILVEHARRHHALKRGGDEAKVPLEEAAARSQERPAALVALDEALTQLARFDERKSLVVELRYIGGLSVEETAEALGVSVATVGRELRLAEAWLRREMTE